MDIALFDFDGTITTRETWPLFMRHAVPRSRQVIGLAALSPLLVGYKLRLVPVSKVRAVLTHVGFRGVREADLLRASEEACRTVLPVLIRPVAIERIRWHQERGNVVVVVSGSLEVFLTHWCQRTSVGLIATRLEATDGILSGRFLGSECCGTEKVRRVREAYALEHFSTVFAYGDTFEDWEMLRIAHKKYYRWQEVS